MLMIGIGLMLDFSYRNTIDLIIGPARYLFTEHSESYEKILFYILAKEMDQFPQIISTRTMDEEGIVSIPQGTMHEQTSSMFDNFVANSSDGKVSQIIIAINTTEGDPIFMNVLYDSVHYLTVNDKSRARFKGESEDYENIRYDYLRIITAPETGSKLVFLSNDSELTFEQLRIAQIGSDMESIDSFQLFSYSK